MERINFEMYGMAWRDERSYVCALALTSQIEYYYERKKKQID